MVAASGIVVVVIALCGLASASPPRAAQRSGAMSRYFKADKLQDEINDLILPLLAPRRKSSSSKPQLQLTELLSDDLKRRSKPYVQLASLGKSGDGMSRDKSPLAIFVAAREGDEQMESADEDDNVSRDSDPEELDDNADDTREAYYNQQQHDKVLDQDERTADEQERDDASNKLESAHDDEANDERVFKEAEDERGVFERAEDVRAVAERVEDIRAVDEGAEDMKAVDESVEDIRAEDERVEDMSAVDERAEDMRAVHERAEDVVRAVDESAEGTRAVNERAQYMRAVEESAEDMRAVHERAEDKRAAENREHDTENQTLDESLSTLQLLSQDIASALRAEQAPGSTEDRRQNQQDTVLECVERRDSAAPELSAEAQELEAPARQASGEHWNHYHHAESRTGESGVEFAPEDSHIDPQKAYHLSFRFSK